MLLTAASQLGMSIDLQAVARHVQCDPVRLRAALTLLEQGFHPSYLLDYRADEIVGVDPFALATLRNAMRAQVRLDKRRGEVRERIEQSAPGRTDLQQQAAQARTLRELDHVARSARAAGAHSASARLAARVWHPAPGDPTDLPELATAVLPELDEPQRAAVLQELDEALAGLALDRNNLVRHGAHWLLGNAKIHIGTLQERSDVHDEHEESDEHDDAPLSAEAEAALDASLHLESDGSASPCSEPAEPAASVAETSELLATGAAGAPTAEPETAATGDESTGLVGGDATETASSTDEALAVGRSAFGEQAAPAERSAVVSSTSKSDSAKRLSPRQRRRRWLIGLLKPIEHKTLPLNRLSAFQVLMLGRAVRSNLVKVDWQYDAPQLHRHLVKHAPAGRHPHAARLAAAVERAAPRLATACEQEAWAEQADRAQGHLLEVLAHGIDMRLNRAPMPGLRILAIDANGNRTAPCAVVAPDGSVLHTEDLPCQLAGNIRQQLVVRLGELVHQFKIDAVVVSNGTARRACLVALRELLAQSTPGSLAWTLVDRNGADLFAADLAAEHPWRSLPRRFRAAAWLARQIQAPAEALVELDLTKTRLATYQRELNPIDLQDLLHDVFSAAAAAKGADVNSTPVSWLARLPGASPVLADRLDVLRRERLFETRGDLLERLGDEFVDSAAQCLGYLRVYGSSEPLDATTIHPADYRLADRLLQALEIPRPPAAPPGYRPPSYRRSPDPAPESTAAVGSSSPSAEGATDEAATATEPAADSPQAESGDWVDLASSTADATDVVATDLGAPVESDSSGTEAPVDSTSAAAQSAEPSASAEETLATHVATTEAAPSEKLEPYRVDPPPIEKVRKLIKEWQLGGGKVEQIIRALIDPFPHPTAGERRGALHTKVAALADLQPGDPVCGVVVGVADFGVFVELAPECSGLVHISRLLPGFILDPHELLQVGDVVQAWVVNVDSGRRRVALSLLSPEQERRMAESRQRRQDERHPPRDRNQESRGERPANQATGGPRRSEGGGRGPAPAREADGPGGAGVGSAAARRGDRRDARSGGPPRGKQGRGRAQDSEDATRTVVVRVAKSSKPLEPISEAKQRGDEPLRSFNDLMQFYKLKQSDEPAPAGGPAAAEPKADPNTNAADAE
jgi:transcriptional accessory protein Tex/SPT6